METKFFFQVLVRLKGHSQLRVYEQFDDLSSADDLASIMASFSLYDKIEIHKIERTLVKSFDK